MELVEYQIDKDTVFAIPRLSAKRKPGHEYHDVVHEPRALYEMIGRVKPIVGPKTPVTVPQIWIDGSYVGGADELEIIINASVEPNPDRGRCSLSTGTGT